ATRFQARKKPDKTPLFTNRKRDKNTNKPHPKTGQEKNKTRKQKTKHYRDQNQQTHSQTLICRETYFEHRTTLSDLP
ncbi:hypothetical protein, partial [Mobiluncus mulieris]|uniref:hypothetical protein n=1 Tax=Mobiluncus mulieris TaxID=2052 RepID=UPI001B8BC224